jgi:hypothetical protein
VAVFVPAELARTNSSREQAKACEAFRRFPFKGIGKRRQAHQNHRIRAVVFFGVIDSRRIWLVRAFSLLFWHSQRKRIALTTLCCFIEKTILSSVID